MKKQKKANPKNFITKTTQLKKVQKNYNLSNKQQPLMTLGSSEKQEIESIPKLNLELLQIKYIERVFQRLVPFYLLNPNKISSLKKLPWKTFKQLSPLTKRTYYLDFQRRISKNKKTLLKTYSTKNLNSKVIISSINPKNNKIAKELDRKKFLIQVIKISKSYFQTSIESKVLEELSLNIEWNSFISILGPSGSGKTTLLNLLSGLDTATQGDIFVDGINLSVLYDRDLTYFRKKYVGFVFQQYNLLNNLTVMENIDVGAALAVKKDYKFINKVIEIIGLKPHIKKYPYQLSGGEQQRVSIARALAKKPRILFCDEPTGALDHETSKKVLKIINKINKETETTVILVTHNHKISKIADVIIEIKKGKVDSLTKNVDKKEIDEIDW